MAKLNKAWTEQALRALKVERETLFGDPGQRGLALRVSPGERGAKVWIWSRRIGGNQAKMTLGNFPAYGIRDSRQWAEVQEALADRCIDPRTVKPKHTPAGDAFEVYLADRKADGTKTVGDIRRHAERDIWPHFAKTRSVTELTRADVVAIMQRPLDRGAGRPGATSGATQANYLRAVLHGFLNFCMVNEIDGLDKNVASAVPKRKVVSKEIRRLLPVEMAKAVLAARDYDAGAEQRLKNVKVTHTHSADAVLLFCLTGCRRNEVFQAPVSEYRDGIWTLPKERSKNGRSHVMALGPVGRDIFERAIKEGRVFLFPGRDGQARSGNEFKLRTALHKRMGAAVEPWTWHSFRHGFRTHIRKLRFATVDVAEHLINHHKGGIETLYDDQDFEEAKAEALLAWERFFMTEIAKLESSNVIALRA